MSPIANQIEPTSWRSKRLALHDWFSDATGIDVIWQNSPTPQPAWPYGSMQVIQGGLDPIHIDEAIWTDEGDDLRVDLRGQREFNLSCQIHGGITEDCLDLALELSELALARLSDPRFLQPLRDAGLSLRGRTQPQEIPSLASAQWVARYQFEVTFGHVSLIETRPGWFETVEISSSLTGFQNNPSGLDLDEEPIP